MKHLVCLSVLACLGAISNADTITVCSSGCDYTSINSAIDVATTGDVIQLSAEIYAEGAVINLDGKAITLLGAIGKDGEPTTILDGSGNHRVLQCQSGETRETVIENLVIRNGSANSGGGMYVSGDPVVTNCWFSDNAATGGGGVHVYLGSPLLVGCVFNDNQASSCGGGVWNEDGGPEFIDCTFSRNNAVRGGGTCSESAGAFVLNSCAFDLNTATDQGGAAWFNGGSNSYHIVVGCQFTGNEAFLGGGVYLGSGGTTALRASSATSNHARGLGGFVFLESGGKTLNVVECQLSNNSAVGFGGGMYAAGDGLIAVTASSACGNSLPQLYGWTNVGDVTLCLQCDDCEDGVASDAPCNTGIRGDFNCDGVYNEADYFDMQADLGICPGDLTGDGRVDGQDLGLLFAAWGLCL